MSVRGTANGLESLRRDVTAEIAQNFPLRGVGYIAPGSRLQTRTSVFYGTDPVEGCPRGSLAIVTLLIRLSRSTTDTDIKIVSLTKKITRKRDRNDVERCLPIDILRVSLDKPVVIPI